MIRRHLPTQQLALVFLLTLAALLVTTSGTLAQSVGDYRSNPSSWFGTMDLTDRASWERYNGSSWSAPTTAQGYPGQNSGTGVVTIQSGHTVTLNVSPNNAIGSLVINGGTLRVNSNNTYTINVSNNVTINSGTLNIGTTSNTSRNLVLNIQGDFIQTGGTVTRTNSNSSTSNIIFSGTSTQHFIKTGGTITNSVRFAVNSGATLDMGTSVLDGNNRTVFILNNGATLITAHPQGITTIEASGSIQTGTRTYNNAASYIYNGIEAQVMGNGPVTMDNLTINNPAGVTLSRNITVNGILDVLENTMLNVAGYTVGGSGTFNLNPNATLRTAHTQGITTSGNTGSIRTTNRNYSTAASYWYNGTATQAVGNGLPAIVNGLTIDNSSATGVNLGSAITVNGALSLLQGRLNLNGNLTLGVGATVAGTDFSATKMINTGSHTITKLGNINADFPIIIPMGRDGVYTPFEIHSLNATSVATGASVTVQSISSVATGVPGNFPLNRHWITSTSGFSETILANVSFGYDASDIPSGGVESQYEISYKPPSGEWAMPNGASPAGVNPMRATQATTLDAIWTASIPERRTFYSLKTGDWDDATVWTHDPSGTQFLNPGNYTPTTSPTSQHDKVVILSGRTITVTNNEKENGSLTVIGTLDFGETVDHSFSTISGTGRIRLAGDNFPQGDAAHFTSAGQGEGTVDYYGESRELTIPRTFYHVELNLPANNVLTLLDNYTINGRLTVNSGTLQINNNSATTALSIDILGDVLVGSNGKIATGSANARHQLNMYGNFTNNGEVRFTNRTEAILNAVATDGIVDANFLSTNSNQSILCRGLTNFYRIKIDKGIDKTYMLSIDATTINNFNLFGDAQEDHSALIPQPTNNMNALGLVRGTVKLGNNIVIENLSIADMYTIPQDARLWVDRGTVKKNMGTNIAIYGEMKVSNGVLESKTPSGITLRQKGALLVEGGTVNTHQIHNCSSGTDNYGGYIQTGGTVNVLGGNVHSNYHVFSLIYPESVFNMSGGTLNVYTAQENGSILINSSPENVKVTGGTVNAIAQASTNYRINSTAPFWNLNFKNESGAARQFSINSATNIGPSANITIPAQPLKVLSDFRIWGTESGGSSYPSINFIADNIDIYIGNSFFIENGANYTPISGGTPPYNHIDHQPTTRNTTYFNRTPGSKSVANLYVGDINNELDLGNLVVDRGAGYELRVTSRTGRGNESIAVDINGHAEVRTGILNQHLYTIRTWGAITNNERMGTWYPGPTPSQAQIQMVENPDLTLTTSSDAVFGNVQINVTPPNRLTLTSDTYIERMEYVKGLIYLKNYNLKVDHLWGMEEDLFESIAINSLMKVANTGYSANSMIFSNGLASDGGLSLKVNTNSLTENTTNIRNNFGPFTFPIGFTPDEGTTLYFRPAQMVVKDFADDGYVTIRTVAGHLQTTNQNGGEVLQHYWRVSHTGFDVKPTVAYRFYYRNNLGVENVDLQSGASQEANYVPGKVIDEYPYTRVPENNRNDIVRNFGTGSNSRAITFNGTSTNGLFNPTTAGFELENANYSAGQNNRFTGGVTIYYSIDNNNVDSNMGAPWNRAASWTRSDILDHSHSPHDSRQPRSNSIPGAGDVVMIGWVPWDDPKHGAIYQQSNVKLAGYPHCIWLTDEREVAEVVFTPMTDPDGNPVARVYRSNFQFRPTLAINGNGERNTYDNDNRPDDGKLIAKLVKGEGLFWNRQSDPDYTLMDVGDFARQDSSYVIYENFTDNGRYINNTPPLLPNVYISNDNWGSNQHRFTFTRDIVTTGNVELLGGVNLVLPTSGAGDIIVGRDLVFFDNNNTSGNGKLLYGRSGVKRTVEVHGDLLMKNRNTHIRVDNPNTNNTLEHELRVHGDIILGSPGNNATGGLVLYTAGNQAKINLYLEGNRDMEFNLINGATPALHRLIVNKGSSIETKAQINCNFTLGGTTSGVNVPKALELQNGLLILNNNNINLNLTTGDNHFAIPSTAGLEIRSGQANATGTSGISLDGLLRLNGGTLNMSGADNPIEYSSSGNAILEITHGNLTVGGQIRRSPTSDMGILTYRQTGGTVIVGNNAAGIGNRGVFEILNEGSSFTMDGGHLHISRGQTNATFPAFYFDPQTYSIDSTANIHIGHSATPANQTVGIYANKPLPQLRINGSSSAQPKIKAVLEVVPVTITSLLQIDEGTSLDANGIDLTLDGDLTVKGDFIPSDNTTYFTGGKPQTIIGNGTPLQFYDMEKNGAEDLNLNAGNTPLRVLNTMKLYSGTFTDNGNTSTILGHLHNDATHIHNGSGDGIVLNGTVQQELTGNGVFGKLTISNPSGVQIHVGNNLSVTRSLKMHAGVLNIGKNFFDLGPDAVIEEASPFSTGNMVETNISFTDNGLRKTFPNGATNNFTYPVGSDQKYTPVTLKITGNGNSTGSITIKPANEIHPSIVANDSNNPDLICKENALQYYWTLKAQGIQNFTATAEMQFVEDDVKFQPPITLDDYYPASLLADGEGHWLKFSNDGFSNASRTLTFSYSNKTDSEISGDYTAGAKNTGEDFDAIPDNVAKYETNQNGNWTTNHIWTPNVANGPYGAIAVIKQPHTVEVTTDYLYGYKTEIYGLLKLYETSGHRLGITNGTGTIYLERGDIPAAVYDHFFSDAGGTLEFGGELKNYEILGNITEVNNLTFSGSGQRKFPNNDLLLNGNLYIEGGNVMNYANRRISIKRDITRIGGSFYTGTGPNATIALIGVLPQTITGPLVDDCALNNLEVNNPHDVDIQNSVEVNRQLRLIDGLINITPSNLFRLNYNATANPAEGTPSSFVNGVLTKEILNGQSFIFPIGNYHDTKSHGPLGLFYVNGPAGINDWEASYFYANATHDGFNTESFDAPISTVSKSEYWKIEGPTGGAANVQIILNGASDIAGSVDLKDLRVAGWNPLVEKWQVVGDGINYTGDEVDGTITTTGQVNFDSYTYFTLATVTPVETSTATIISPNSVSICSGSSTTIRVSFSGNIPFILTYTDGSNTITTPAITTNFYEITVSPNTTTTYTLLGVTSDGQPGEINGVTSVTVTVSPVPSVSIISNKAYDTICEGEDITFTATPGLINYNFRVNGETVQNSSNNSYTTASLTNLSYTVDVVGTNAGNCSNTSLPLTVTVNPLPDPAGLITGPDGVCKDTQHEYTIPPIPNATNYVWSVTGATIVSGTDTEKMISFTNPGEVTIEVYGENNCGNGVISSLTVIVSEDEMPGDAGVITGEPQVCTGGNGHIFSVVPVENATSYIWEYSGNGATIDGTGSTVTITFAPGATSGNLTVKGTNGCADGGTSPNFSITVMPSPTASIIEDEPMACSGTALELHGTATGGNGTYSHHWEVEGHGSDWFNPADAQNTIFTPELGGDYFEVAYTVTDGNGCYDVATTSIYVFPAPVANAGPDLDGICSGTNPITLTGASATGTYSDAVWSGPGGTWTNNPDPALATFKPGNPSGTITATLTLTGTNGCPDATDTREISWNQEPNQPGQFIESTATVCQGYEGVIYSVPDDPVVTTYIWTYSGSGVTINNNGNHSVTLDFSELATGGRLSVRAENDCGISPERFMVITVGTVPPAQIISGVETTCAGAEGDLYEVTFNENWTYSWNIEDNIGLIVTSENPNSITVNWNNNDNISWPTATPTTVIKKVSVEVNTVPTGCPVTLEWDVTIHRVPVTGPPYHIPNLHTP